MRILLAMMALAAAVPAAAQTAPDDGIGIPGIPAKTDAAYQIMSGMEASADGWNSGDLDRFLAIYSDDPGTSFAGSGGVVYGKTGIRARYLVSYGGQFGENRALANMSVLSFARENFRMIGADHALLIARWTLTKKGEEPKTGMTSLLFRHEAGGWKIIADHSS